MKSNLFAEDNLNLIIITTPSLQLQITIGHMHSLPSNIYRIEGRMSSAMYRTPNLTIMIVRMKNANFIIFTFKQLWCFRQIQIRHEIKIWEKIRSPYHSRTFTYLPPGALMLYRYLIDFGLYGSTDILRS